MKNRGSLALITAVVAAAGCGSSDGDHRTFPYEIRLAGPEGVSYAGAHYRVGDRAFVPFDARGRGAGEEPGEAGREVRVSIVLPDSLACAAPQQTWRLAVDDHGAPRRVAFVFEVTKKSPQVIVGVTGACPDQAVEVDGRRVGSTGRASFFDLAVPATPTREVVVDVLGRDGCAGFRCRLAIGDTSPDAVVCTEASGEPIAAGAPETAPAEAPAPEEPPVIIAQPEPEPPPLRVARAPREPDRPKTRETPSRRVAPDPAPPTRRAPDRDVGRPRRTEVRPTEAAGRRGAKPPVRKAARDVPDLDPLNTRGRGRRTEPSRAAPEPSPRDARARRTEPSRAAPEPSPTDARNRAERTEPSRAPPKPTPANARADRDGPPRKATPSPEDQRRSAEAEERARAAREARVRAARRKGHGFIEVTCEPSGVSVQLDGTTVEESCEGTALVSAAPGLHRLRLAGRVGQNTCKSKDEFVEFPKRGRKNKITLQASCGPTCIERAESLAAAGKTFPKDVMVCLEKIKGRRDGPQARLLVAQHHMRAKSLGKAKAILDKLSKTHKGRNSAQVQFFYAEVLARMKAYKAALKRVDNAQRLWSSISDAKLRKDLATKIAYRRATVLAQLYYVGAGDEQSYRAATSAYEHAIQTAQRNRASSLLKQAKSGLAQLKHQHETE